MNRMELAYVCQLLDEHDRREQQVNCSLMLRNLRLQVEAAIPGCRTTMRNDQWAWVYMPEEHIAMGAVGFGNLNQNGRGASTYAVHARNIVNGKYSSGSRQHNMLMSSNLSVAVKNAKKFLRRLSPTELVQHTHSHVRDAINYMRTTAREVIMKEELRLFGSNLHARDKAPILKEIRHLVDAGHKFLDISMSEQLSKYFSLCDEHKESQRPYDMLFVSITQSGGKQRFDVVPVEQAENHWPRMGDPQTLYDDVPEYLLGRLAVLSMVDVGTFVPGVGFKHTEGLFYVAR
jgi:hypothetical protein